MIGLTVLQSALITLCLAGFPLVAGLSSAIELESTPFSIAVRAATAVISIVVITLGSRARRGDRVYYVLFGLFWLVYAFRLWVDTSIGADRLSRPPSDYWTWAFGACMLPALGVSYGASDGAMRSALRTSTFLLILAAFLAMAYGSTNFVNSEGVVVDIGRLNLKALDPISIGHLGVTTAILAIWRLASRSENRPKTAFAKLICVGGVFLGLALVVFSSSRGPFVALLAVVAIYLATRRLRRMFSVALLSAAVLGFLAQAALYSDIAERYSFANRLNVSQTDDDPSIAGRELAYAGAIRQFLRSPIYGDFLEEESTHYYPHNILLEAFMFLGLLGGIPFVILLARSFVHAFRILRAGSPFGWVGLLYVQYLVGGQFSGAIYTSTALWSLIGLLGAMSERRPRHTMAGST
jgi:O-antigen ligase